MYCIVNFFIVKFNIESISEIDGFLIDEENDEEFLDCEMDFIFR